ncbi:hypothetical protein SASPL_127662 [Salvia splendens]|uniref:Uncharacterized protein n=1 Tax=Salvia splendens TaxID=180675 RepID=A0A8X8XDI8_SALSN|nr:hypothetical protein SASPL_127662 [Salvia splendens]
MASSPPPTGTELAVPSLAAESQLSSLIYASRLICVSYMAIMKSLLHEYHILPYKADLMIPEFVMPTVINRYLSQNLQVSMDNMLKIISEIEQNSGGITEEIEKSKESALQRKIQLEEKRDSFQKTTYAIFDMLNGRNTS